ncbi:MAG: hypothetical protein IJU65_04535 [Desulfovibrio sp.]|nr:hypothetical protein [Desulfovibrio sp.]
MPVHTKVHSQSGFMSVEAIATTLFYLIMVAAVTLIAANIMNNGKMATAISTLSQLRVNIQYVGTNVGGYTETSSLPLENVVSGVTAVTPGTASAGVTLPTGTIVKAALATATDIDPDTNAALGAVNPAYFTFDVSNLSPQDCRKIAYYGRGAAYGMTINGAQVTTATPVSDIESACSTITLVQSIRLTSK